MQRIISSVPRRYSPGTVTEYRDVTLLSVEPSFTPPIARMSDFWPGTQSRLMWPRRATWSPSYKREKPSIKVAAAHVCVQTQDSSGSEKPISDRNQASNAGGGGTSKFSPCTAQHVDDRPTALPRPLRNSVLIMQEPKRLVLYSLVSKTLQYSSTVSRCRMF